MYCLFFATLQLTVLSCLLAHVDEGFDLRDDDSQDQLTPWTKSRREFSTALGAVCKVAVLV